MELSKSGRVLLSHSEFGDCVLLPTDSATLLPDVSAKISSERIEIIAKFAQNELGTDIMVGETLPTESGLIALPRSTAINILKELEHNIFLVTEADEPLPIEKLFPKKVAGLALDRCMHLCDDLNKVLNVDTKN